jgi:hypothetical protein
MAAQGNGIHTRRIGLSARAGGFRHKRTLSSSQAVEIRWYAWKMDEDHRTRSKGKPKNGTG